MGTDQIKEIEMAKGSGAVRSLPKGLELSKEKETFIDAFNKGEFSDDYKKVIEYAKTHDIESDYYPDVKYSPEAKQDIESWQDGGDVYVHMLQEGKKISNPKAENLGKRISQTFEGIYNQYATEKNMIVYRVVGNEYKYGKNDYYVSVSTSPRTVGIYGSDTEGAKIQAFKVPKGTNCIVVGNEYQGQYEIILNAKKFDFEKNRIK